MCLVNPYKVALLSNAHYFTLSKARLYLTRPEESAGPQWVNGSLPETESCKSHWSALILVRSSLSRPD